MTAHRNTIVRGNCLDILPQLDAGSADFILTDPPYITRYKPRDGRTVPNDDNDAWLKPAFAEMHRVLQADGFCFTFYGWTHPDRFMQAFRAAGFRPVGHFAFVKRYASSVGHVRCRHETAYLLAKGNPRRPDHPNRINGEFYDLFASLGRMPGQGHARKDLTMRPVLFFPLYSFLVVYQPDVKPIRIMAVLRGKRNLKRILRERL